MWSLLHGARSSQISSRVAAIPIGALIPSRTRRRRTDAVAALIPGDGIIETTTIGGFANFFALYQNVIVVRILLSWFPPLAQQPFFRPLYVVCDPFLNAFRSIVPPVFGLDLSPILGLFLLQGLGSASLALGAELPEKGQETRSLSRQSQRRSSMFSIPGIQF